mmetsp:Transcript_42930/g.105859  ORF Transcript_42930/g.105859 Transcript_42930/m.105859 type:complete len:209 (-) Transcript_42930:359-985(-)
MSSHRPRLACDRHTPREKGVVHDHSRGWGLRDGLRSRVLCGHGNERSRRRYLSAHDWGCPLADFLPPLAGGSLRVLRDDHLQVGDVTGQTSILQALQLSRGSVVPGAANRHHTRTVYGRVGAAQERHGRPLLRHALHPRRRSCGAPPCARPKLLHDDSLRGGARRAGEPGRTGSGRARKFPAGEWTRALPRRRRRKARGRSLARRRSP